MTPYVIFVIVLTIAYIIYYGYNISKDLYGKKNEKDTPVEEFDVSGMRDEVVATPVRESGDGFSFGEETTPGGGTGRGNARRERQGPFRQPDRKHGRDRRDKRGRRPI